MVVAGPGVIAARAQRGLRAMAEITGATVVNAVNAKGLFRWDDPLHGGTIGLQAGDAELAEITSADLVVTTGLDPADSASLTAALATRAEDDPDDVIEIHPGHLAWTAGGWPPAEQPGARPPIYERIASVVGPMYEAGPDADGRIAPPRAAAALAAARPPGGLVVAAPGAAGFWIGRTFPTTEPGSVVITTGDPPGTAETLALLAARFDRPTTLVVATSSTDPHVIDLRELGLAEGVPLQVEVWSTDAVDQAGPGVTTIRWEAIDRLVAVAGDPEPQVWSSRPDPFG